MPLEPASLEEIAEAVCSHRTVLAIGARSKPRLSEVSPEVTLLSLRRMRGITDYDPSEFTFTALAGTPMREIVATLAEQGQYLPFDPVFIETGATLGGTVAAGINGPGRMRYGGIRDFILAVQFIDGTGQLLRGGAKVVKNAAGFDIPKFLVGSLGRFGVMTELTFKVFPRPVSWVTLCAPVPAANLATRLSEAARGRWEIDALEYDAHEGLLYARLGGPEAANAALASELLTTWPRAFIVPAERALECWREAAEFQWAAAREVLLKVPVTLQDLAALSSLPTECRVRIAGAGTCAWIALPAAAVNETAKALNSAGLAGLAIRGTGVPLYTTAPAESATTRAVQQVFDADRRFARC